jgi:glycosyltransferase involved in cell wall biosynthesis
VSLDELGSLYRRAAALVFPSLYEGFGQPPLEAMACGCPVACSVAASLPEVCGEAARYFDPDEPEEIAAAVEDVLADPEAWSARGIAHAAGFTWERSAALHEDVYRELLDTDG